jgi:hypothetical protein
MQVELETRREETRASYTSALTRFIWQPHLQSFVDAIRTPFVAVRLVSAVQQQQLFPSSLVVGLPREIAARSTPQRTRTRSLHLMSLRRRSIGCVSIMKRAQIPLNLQEKQYAQILTSNTRAGSPGTTALLHPDDPDPIGTTTLKPPTDEPMEFSVSIDPSLVTGDVCFNDMVRQQLANAQEEVTCLLDANCFLLTVNSGDANMYANMYEHVLQGKDKRATEQAEAFQALEEMFRAERESFRLRINGLTDNLQIYGANLRRANRHLQHRYTRKATMSDLVSEHNTYGKRKWSQIATEI